MTGTDERQPLLANTEQQDDLERGDTRRADHDGEAEETLSWREWTAEKLEAPSTHKAIIFLIAIDACCVLADLVYTFLSPGRECPNVDINALSSVLPSSPSSFPAALFSQSGEPGHEPTWLTILSHISLTINTLFLLEIPLALWCFGLAYYNPLSQSSSSDDEKHPYAGLHLFDALVVISTFVLEVVLRGREAEVAGLLILLRLWRLVKLVGGIAKGAGELQEELSDELSETKQLLAEARARASQLEQENEELRAHLAQSEVAASSASAPSPLASTSTTPLSTQVDLPTRADQATQTDSSKHGGASSSDADGDNDIEVERWVLVLSELDANGNRN